MADEAELEIKIIPDEESNLEIAQAADEKAVAKEAKAEVEIKDPAVKELADQYKEAVEREEAANRRAALAETEAARHRTEAETAKKQVATSQLDTITTALNAAKADAEQAKRDIRIAKDAGDIDAEIDAQDRLAQSRADERRLDEARSDLEFRAKYPPTKDKRRVDYEDPVEAFVHGRTAPTANWLRAHPEFIRDPRKQHKLTAAHYDAEGEGLVPDTQAYFEHVERFLGISQAEPVTKSNGKAPTEAAQVKPRGAPVAPVANSGNGGASSGGNLVMLTKGEAASATDGTLTWNYDDPKGKFKKGEPIGLEEFAKRKRAQQKQGLHDKNSYEA